MTDFDWLIVIGYCAALLCVGYCQSRRNKTLDDFLLGGRRCRSFPVAASLFVSWFSVISYLTWPGEVIANGPLIFVGLVAAPLVIGFVGWVVVPKLRQTPWERYWKAPFWKPPLRPAWETRHNQPTSAYEILEPIGCRRLGSCLFLAMRVAWMGMITYIIATVVMPSLTTLYPWATAVGLVAVTVAYSLGGYCAVVWTDCLQAVLMFGGAVMIVVVVGMATGEGFWTMTVWPAHWAAPSWSCNPCERITVPWAILSAATLGLCVKAGDQMNVQRYLSTPSVPAAQRVLVGSFIMDVALTALLALVGLSLLSYYAGGPNDADAFMLQFISEWFPAGIRGLVVAALLAAAMSSLSSGINACVSTVAVDWQGHSDDAGNRTLAWPGIEVRSRAGQPIPATIFIGLAVLLVSLGIGLVEGNLLELCYKIVNLLATPLGGLMLVALFIPGATKWGARVGCIASVAVVVWVNYFSPLSFLCAAPLALSTQLLIAFLGRTK